MEMKKTILLISVIFFSCNSKTENFQSEIVKLKHKNDSLQNIIDTLNTKYIFDNAYLYAYPIEPVRNKNNENVLILSFIASNKSDKIVYGTKYNLKKGSIINPDTLKTDEVLKIKRTNNDTLYYFQSNKPKYGKEYGKFTSFPMKNFP